MAKAKVHFDAQAPTSVQAVRRVAHYCGAITQHAVPELMVQETSARELVTCGNCLQRLKKAA